MWIILSSLVLTSRETNQQVKIDTSMCPSILFIYQGHKLQNFYLLYAIDDLLHNFSHILQRRRPKYNHLSSDNTYFLLRYFTHMEVSNLLLNFLRDNANWNAYFILNMILNFYIIFFRYVRHEKMNYYRINRRISI